jgi:hypothetical protein
MNGAPPADPDPVIEAYKNGIRKAMALARSVADLRRAERQARTDRP